MAGMVMEKVKEFLTTKNYDKFSNNEQVGEAIANRLSGYQSICLFGLGGMFWGGAMDVLTALHEEEPTWAYYFSIYFAISILLMLTGLTASIFKSSSPWALGVAGLGAWQALVSVLVTFHIAALKFHFDSMHCFYSMVVSIALFTIYWAYSAQDPLILHVFVKCIVEGPYVICCTVFRWFYSKLLIVWEKVSPSPDPSFVRDHQSGEYSRIS